MREKSYRILGIAQEYAPSIKEQQQLSEILWNMQEANESEDTIVQTFASIISNGIKTGNWPWNIVTANEN